MIKLFESFNEIRNICEKYNIQNYTINSDGSVDVNENIILKYLRLKKIPLNFNEVTGNFYCFGNDLTNLEGAPKKVDDFFCNDNQLTSLEGAPQKVDGLFNCRGNNIWTFEGAPDRVSDKFECEYNPICNIWVLFRDYSKIELFNYYDIIREIYGKPAIVLDRLNDFLEEVGKKPVEGVKGYLNI